MLQNHHLFHLFDHIVCVDDKLEHLPTFITCVPVIVTPDYDVPLIDDTVFQWIEFKMSQKKTAPEMPRKISPVPEQFPMTAILSSTRNDEGISTNVNVDKKQTIANNYEQLMKQRALDDESFNQR